VHSETSSVTAVLGPTNTGKTHLAVERMCAHSSGMIGFPLRLLAREVYDRIVAIKGENKVALITGEERIEPPNAQYYCCTAESMPVNFSDHAFCDGTMEKQRDFAFVALDEAQNAIDPERGHIFTDRILHARGREETMILGAESLRPLIRNLLPEAQIINRPRFSTLSYGGAKKLSRLPKRSAIVAFSVEEVYSIAEMLRRFRGGAAVVMGALSPHTRNAQVDMYQSGEVDYLVATDAIGMGLNLDVSHVAFASLRKFDGQRRRRLTVSEMAQIAGRAGRHHSDGSFISLAGECEEFTPEEIIAIEEHDFPPLPYLYWRNSDVSVDSLEELLSDLSLPPSEKTLLGSRLQELGLRTAPESLDLSILKRLSEMDEIKRGVNRPYLVSRLWAAACLPDFRQMGGEYHARFIASLWKYLGYGNGTIHHGYAANEIARLDNIQGGIDTLSARLSAVRSWSYIAQRADWLENPIAIGERAKSLEEKLSNAMHQNLRERFVDRRTSLLMKAAGADPLLLEVEVDDNNIISVEGETLGRLNGFQFEISSGAKHQDKKILLAAAERYLGATLKKRAKEVFMSADSEFSLGENSEGRPAVIWKENLLGLITAGRDLLNPVFKPSAVVAGLEGDALRDVTDRATSWMEEQIAKHLGGVKALIDLSQNAHVDGNVRALAVQLADSGGVASRQRLLAAVQNLAKESRGAARNGGIVFGALDLFHHAALKPGAARWRAALMAARNDKPVLSMPPESAVHLKEFKFINMMHSYTAGYRRVGNEYLRIDLAERIIKKAHEARGKDLNFGFDMTFVTSLGLGEQAFCALMQDAGFKKTKAPVEVPENKNNISAKADANMEEAKASIILSDSQKEEEIQQVVESSAEASPDNTLESEAISEMAAVSEVQTKDILPADQKTEQQKTEQVDTEESANTEEGTKNVATKQPIIYSYWKWKGIRHPKKKVPSAPQTDMGAQLAALTMK